MNFCDENISLLEALDNCDLISEIFCYKCWGNHEYNDDKCQCFSPMRKNADKNCHYYKQFLTFKKSVEELEKQAAKIQDEIISDCGNNVREAEEDAEIYGDRSYQRFVWDEYATQCYPYGSTSGGGRW